MRADLYLMALFYLCSVQQPNRKQLHSAVILTHHLICSNMCTSGIKYFSGKENPDLVYTIFIIRELNIVTDLVILNKEMFDENVYTWYQLDANNFDASELISLLPPQCFCFAYHLQMWL